MTSSFPPRLSMEEYIAFLGENWRHGDRDMQARQKKIEERIEKPFRMPPDRALAEANVFRPLRTAIEQ